MARRSLRLLVAAVLVLGVGAGVWHLRDVTGTPRAAPAAPGGEIDWASVLAELPFEGFEGSSAPWRLTLPEDHGAHPEARTETWLLGAHLRTEAGEAIGVQLALLRVALAPPDAPARESAWAAREVYRGHVAIVTGAQRRGVGEERFARAALGLAGHAAEERRVWLEGWSLRYGEGDDGSGLTLDARLGETSVTLLLQPDKPPLATGEGDERAPFRGFALSRLAATGSIRRPDGEEPISGLAWLDRAWGEIPLPVGPVVWDRMQLHLDDGSDVSLIRTRRRTGGGTPTTRGFVVDADGTARPLEVEATQMTPESAGEGYPLRWRVSAGDLQLDVEPLVEEQSYDFAAPLWSGVVIARGSAGADRVSGSGYMELSGYEDP